MKLSVAIPKDLILKFCPIITEENMSCVGADGMRNSGMNQYSSRLIRQGSQDCETTKVVYKNKYIGRALDTVWQLQKVSAYNVEGSGWQWVLKDRSCLCCTLDFSTRYALAICLSMSRCIVGQ